MEEDPLSMRKASCREKPEKLQKGKALHAPRHELLQSLHRYFGPKPPPPPTPASHVCPEQLFLRQRALDWEPQIQACSRLDLGDLASAPSPPGTSVSPCAPSTVSRTTL